MTSVPVAPSKPLLSVKTSSPYNYTFSYGITPAENTFFARQAA